MKLNQETNKEQERRRDKRISYWLLARFCQNEEFKHIDIKNISKGGMLLATRENIDADNDISIQIYVPSVKGYDKIHLTVKPIWKKQETDEYTIGTQFVDLDTETKNILYNFLEYLIMLQNLGDNVIGIPYWCIAEIEIIEASPVPESNNPQVKIMFESTVNFNQNRILSLDLKLPTHTMPFTIEGIVLESKPKQQHSNFWIKLGLYRLSQKHLQAIKAMAIL